MKDSILVVEDGAVIRGLLRDLFESEGYAVQTASNGRAALELLQSGARPSLIFLDLMMPYMNGQEFLEALPTAVPHASATPVYVLSAGRESVSVPVAGQLKKPVDIEDLLAIAARHCG